LRLKTEKLRICLQINSQGKRETPHDRTPQIKRTAAQE
jgi:hypothetical protein